MSMDDDTDLAPGDEYGASHELVSGARTYLIGFLLAAGLTVMSFALPGTQLIWEPAVPIALIVFAIAQMGVHLVFFLHITTAPDNTNNVLALAFGILVVFLLVGGSIWIMNHMYENMMPASQLMQMQP